MQVFFNLDTQQMFFLTFSYYTLANALVESAYGTYGKNLSHKSPKSELGKCRSDYLD